MDVWCAGILAYELLIGGPPFEADTKEATYTRILKTEPLIPAHISRAAQDFIRSALQKDPELRPTIEQLAGHPWLKSAQRGRSGTGSPIISASGGGGGMLGEGGNEEEEAVAVPASTGAPVVQKQQQQQQQSQQAPVHQSSSVCMAYSAKEGHTTAEHTTHAAPSVAMKNESLASAAAFAAVSPPSSPPKHLQRTSATQSLMNPAFKHRQSMQAQAQVQALVSATMPQTRPAAAGKEVVVPMVKIITKTAPTAAAAASAMASNGAREKSEVDLIAASYGSNNSSTAPHAIMPSQPSAAVQILAKPPPPTSGSSSTGSSGGKSRRPRILSAYLKKLNISAFMGIGSSSDKEDSQEEKSGEPTVKLSRLAAGSGV